MYPMALVRKQKRMHCIAKIFEIFEDLWSLGISNYTFHRYYMRGVHLKRKPKYTEKAAAICSWLLHPTLRLICEVIL